MEIKTEQPKISAIYHDKDWPVYEHPLDYDVMETLMQYEIIQLQELFKELLKINITKDILEQLESEREIDKGFGKSNISRILTHYILKTFENKYINLKDKFFKCKICFSWSYFTMQERDVCYFCFDKRNGLEVNGLW